jgi:hypothetical protein
VLRSAVISPDPATDVRDLQAHDGQRHRPLHSQLLPSEETDDQEPVPVRNGRHRRPLRLPVIDAQEIQPRPNAHNGSPHNGSH